MNLNDLANLGEIIGALAIAVSLCYVAQLKRRNVYKVAVACALVGGWASAHAQDGISLDETAHFLAGMPVQGRLASLTQTAGWQAHAAALDKAWKTKEFFQLGPIAAWMSAHAGDYYRSSNTMYYMFSGPDFLYAYTFFPNANTYILAGLEPVGHVPDVSRMNPAALVNNLTPLRNSMSTLLITHYFVTEEMKASLGRSELGGPFRFYMCFWHGWAAIFSRPLMSVLPPKASESHSPTAATGKPCITSRPIFPAATVLSCAGARRVARVSV